MPIIDLKNVDVYLEDGTEMDGLVNNVAGYAAGVTTILVNTFVGVVPVGARLDLNGDDQYTVVSTIETSGNTTSITFTPALAAALVDDDPVTAWGVYLKIKVGDGTLTYSEKVTREFKMDRGRLYQVRNGDEVPMDVSTQFMYEELTASDPNTDPPTPEDVLKKRGAAADWVNTNPDTCAPHAVNIRFDHIPPCETFLTERVILKQFYYEELNHDLKAGTISCTGKCNATEALVTRLGS